MTPPPIPTKPKRKLSAFTLVELIVVITILAILGTVGFLSLGGYSSNARDSQRSTDIANLSKSLDVSVITVGSYPSPDNSFSVTYSGGTVWYQGTFSTGALSKLGGNGLNKRPLDPLKSSEYTYSTLAFGKAYSIKADYEGSVALSDMLVPTAYAAPGNPTVAFVRGNYGGLSAKTETGSITYVIALPSILTNTGSAGGTLEIKSNALSGTLLFNGKNLVNASSFNPTTVVFSGASLPKDDKAGQVTAMMTALKNAYASSDVTSVPAVQTLVNTATGSLATLGTSVIVSQLGGSASSVPMTTVACSPGTYSATGNSPCTTASAGYYVSSTGATSQVACTIGTSPAGSINNSACVGQGEFVTITHDSYADSYVLVKNQWGTFTIGPNVHQSIVNWCNSHGWHGGVITGGNTSCSLPGNLTGNLVTVFNDCNQWITNTGFKWKTEFPGGIVNGYSAFGSACGNQPSWNWNGEHSNCTSGTAGAQVSGCGYTSSSASSWSVPNGEWVLCAKQGK